jgi:hypothetical protein
MTIKSIADFEADEDEAFLRSVVLCEEERRRLYPGVEWRGGFRWFRSANVIPMERFRPSRQRPQPSGLKPGA